MILTSSGGKDLFCIFLVIRLFENDLLDCFVLIYKSQKVTFPLIAKREEQCNLLLFIMQQARAADANVGAPVLESHDE